MIRIILLGATLAILGGRAGADEYWIAYEGNDFPEIVGWERLYGDGGADRWIEDGALVIDSTRSTGIFDFYRIAGIADPEPGELFVAEWRIRVDEFIRFYDAELVLARDGRPGHMQVKHGLNDIIVRPIWNVIAIEPGQWHSFRIESSDMQTFRLDIDGTPRYEGPFESQSFLQSFLAFGDTTTGAASLSRWDYVRFGVIPEPASISMCFVTSFLVVRRR